MKNYFRLLQFLIIIIHDINKKNLLLLQLLTVDTSIALVTSNNQYISLYHRIFKLLIFKNKSIKNLEN